MNTEALEIDLQALLAPFRAAMERAYALGQQDALNAITASVKAAQPAPKKTHRMPFGTQRAKIREVLAQHPTVTSRDVAKLAGIETYRAAVELAALTKAGEVVRVSPGVYARAQSAAA